jgi:hypothetical protein
VGRLSSRLSKRLLVLCLGASVIVGWTSASLTATCNSGGYGLCMSSPNSYYNDCDCDCIGIPPPCGCGQGPPQFVCVVQHCCKEGAGFLCSHWSGPCTYKDCYGVGSFPSDGEACNCQGTACM